MRHSFLLLLLCLFANTSFANSSLAKEQQLAESILKKLFNTYGNYIYPIPPKIEVVNEKKRVAAFIADKQSGKIVIEKAVFDICRTFGKDYESALAFIIGHELGHFFERTNNKGFATNYLKWTHTQKEEEKADIWGVFCAYLADYKTTSIVPKLIEAIYLDYGLMGKKDELYGYPTFKIRQASAENVLEQIDELVDIFDTANFLNAMGKYELAAASYQYMLQFYKGREIYNNLGVNYALHAMNFTPKNVDQFLYPFEIDTNTRLKKPKLDRGGEDLTEAEQAYRMRMLDNAKANLDIAGKMDYNYLSDDINTMGVLSLMMDLCKDCENPIQYYNKNEFPKTADFMGASNLEKSKLELALAIAYAKSGNKAAAKKIWTALQTHKNPHICYQATFNLETIKEDYAASFIKVYDCPKIDLDLDSEQVRMHRVEIENGFEIDNTEGIQLEIQALKKSKLFIFENNKGNLFILRRWKIQSGKMIEIKQPTNFQLISAANGFYLICNDTGVTFLLDNTGRITDYATFFSN